MNISDLKNELIMFVMWIGMWGIVENIVEMIIPSGNHGVRICVFSIVFLVSVVLLYSNKCDDKNENKQSNETKKKITIP